MPASPGTRSCRSEVVRRKTRALAILVPPRGSGPDRTSLRSCSTLRAAALAPHSVAETRPAVDLRCETGSTREPPCRSSRRHRALLGLWTAGNPMSPVKGWRSRGRPNPARAVRVARGEAGGGAAAGRRSQDTSSCGIHSQGVANGATQRSSSLRHLRPSHSNRSGESGKAGQSFAPYRAKNRKPSRGRPTQPSSPPASPSDSTTQRFGPAPSLDQVRRTIVFVLRR